MTNSKQLFFLFCITFSWYLMPMNKSANNINYKQHFVQSVQKHPKKTSTGALLLGYGLNLLHKGSTTRNIRPDKYSRYDQQGFQVECVGGLLIAIGISLLYPVVRDMIYPEDANTKN